MNPQKALKKLQPKPTWTQNKPNRNPKWSPTETLNCKDTPKPKRNPKWNFEETRGQKIGPGVKETGPGVKKTSAGAIKARPQIKNMVPPCPLSGHRHCWPHGWVTCFRGGQWVINKEFSCMRWGTPPNSLGDSVAGGPYCCEMLRNLQGHSAACAACRVNDTRPMES